MTWLAATVDIPDGKALRFGPDEAAGRTLLGVTFDTQIPGGFGHATLTIPRDPTISVSETNQYLLAPTTIYGQGGDVAWDGRVADVGEVGPDRVELQLEGWSASLEDNKSFRCVYVHRDLEAWTGPSLTRLQTLGVTATTVQQHETANDVSTPGITFPTTGTSSAAGLVCEAWLDMGASEWVDQISASWSQSGISALCTAHAGSSSDEVGTSTDTTADQATAAASGTVDHSPTADYRYARLYLLMPVAETGAGTRPWIWWDIYVVGGSHSVDVTDEGVLASDVVADVVKRAAPMLTVGQVDSSIYRIPHLVFDRVTPLAVIEKVSGLDGGEGLIPDWGVYEDRVFFWVTAGSLGKTWRVRGEVNADPRDEGPTAVGRATQAIVSYTDANGRSLSIGPVGSGCDTESDELLDTDPSNPYVRAGTVATLPVDAGIVQDPDAAIAIGKLALREANADPRSGSIEIAGEARDEDGHTWPVWKSGRGIMWLWKATQKTPPPGESAPRPMMV